MTDIYMTIESYESATKGNTNPYILKVLEKGKENAIEAGFKGDVVDHYLLYLAGNNKHLTETRLNDDDIKSLCRCLKFNHYVRALDLRYNNITDKGAEMLATLLQQNSTLEELNLMCCEIKIEGAKALAQALQKNRKLKSLKLTGNKIGDIGGMFFAQALQVNNTLERLDLGDTDQEIQSLLALATVLNYNSAIKAINVNRPVLFTTQEEPVVHFAKMLKVNISLKELHMEKYDMRDFGVTRIAENLMDNIHLTYLNLKNNRLTRDGAKEIAKLLKKDTPLQVLDLGYNRLGDDGAMHIAKALSGFNSHLKTLSLKSNEIRGKGLCAVADCVKFSPSLANVYIWGNDMEESACIAFSNLRNTGRLERHNTDVDPYVVDGRIYLAELTHGINLWYYWGPSYGDQAQKEIVELIS